MNGEFDDLISDESGTRKYRAISFRVTEKEYERIEEAARKRGEQPNVWSRNFILAESEKEFAMTWVERLLYEEIARVRFLLGSGFSLIAMGSLTKEVWMELIDQADSESSGIADTLLHHRSRPDSSGGNL